MKLQILEKGRFYHLYNRGINGCNIFSNDGNKLYFLKQVQKYLVEKMNIYAYCLMDNHFHMVVELTQDEKIVTQAISNLFNSYAKAYNKQNQRTGSLFDKHFKRIIIEDESYLRDLITYVHLNPFHHFGIDYKSYKFSSFGAFLTQKETRLMREEVIKLYGDLENFKFCHENKIILLSEKHTFE